MAGAPPPKKKKYQQKWCDSYSNKWKCLSQYKYCDKLIQDPFSAWCTYCESSFLISHGGSADCDKHCGSGKHLASAKKKQGMWDVKQMFQSGASSTLDNKAIRDGY